MPNFNSREVAKKLSTLLNLHAYMSPGDNLIAKAAAILDSALLAAHPEAERLEYDIFTSYYKRKIIPKENANYNFYKNGELFLAEKDVEPLLSAALESAKREERETIRRDIENWGLSKDQAATIHKRLDSLEEKEGPHEKG